MRGGFRQKVPSQLKEFVALCRNPPAETGPQAEIILLEKCPLIDEYGLMPATQNGNGPVIPVEEVQKDWHDLNLRVKQLETERDLLEHGKQDACAPSSSASSSTGRNPTPNW